MNLSEEVVRWYQGNRRDLPWRHTNDAYIIWLSEIILQQTRVEQGLPYFYRFLENYPDVASFARASEDEILKLWQGLGYYSRGRNMLKTARLVVENHDGVFPVRYAELIRLKGIGEYTAAAIASFAAGEAKAVVDGNVYRVLARYFGIAEPINSPKGKKLFQGIADEILNGNDPGLHNQAMMEFGAILCKPKAPGCNSCPVNSSCRAFSEKTIDKLPVKLKTVQVKERYLNYVLINNGGQILMNRRGDGDIWANMYDLPMIETPAMVEPPELLSYAGNMFGPELTIEKIHPPVKHILTHQRLFVQFIELKGIPHQLQPGWFYSSVNNLKNLALPKVIFIFLKNIFNL